MMKILICDDDELFSEDLEKKLEQYEINHRDEFDIHVVNHGEEALQKLKEEQWDVLFLDIEMPNINGVEVGTRVREQLQNYGLKIIYVSSQRGYAMDLFKVDTFDFLIKPVKYEELEEVMNKLMNTLNRSGEMFVYHKKGQTARCKMEDILYFEKKKKKTFFYCHKSILVNYDRVAEFHYDKLVLDNGEELEISQAKRKEVRKLSSEMGMEQ